MTVTQIIEQLYRSKDLDDCIRKTVRPDLQSDFKHELILILYDKSPELIQRLHEAKQLTFYVVRIILNLVNQSRNIYHKTYINPAITYDNDKLKDKYEESENFEERLKKEEKELKILKAFDNLDSVFNTFYYRRLIQEVAKQGGVRKASRATGIPRSSISDSIKKVREHLNKIYNDSENIEGIY